MDLRKKGIRKLSCFNENSSQVELREDINFFGELEHLRNLELKE